MKKITLTLIIMLFTALGFSQTTFNYTGSVQTYTVPAGVTEINIEAYGAQGEDNATASGGLGGFISGDLSVTPGEVLSIYVGGQDGFNGGGTEGTGSAMPGYNGVNGGGASDVRQNGTSLTDRIIVAGGGGGAGRGDCSNNNGGGGGYPGGLGGNSSNEPTNTGGTGTSTAGGDSGAGSCTGDCACSPGGGGGGGGDGGGAGGGYGISGGTIALGGTSGACGGNGDDTVGGLGSGGFGGCFGNGGDGGNTTNGGGAGGGGGWYGGGAGGGNWASGGGGGSSYILPSASNLASTNNSNPGNGVITITPLCTGLTITTTPSENVCPGTQVTITGVSSNGGIVTWDNGITNGVAFTATTTTTYTSSSTAPNDCVATVTITVEDTEDPIITCVADDTRDTDAGVCEYTVVGTEFDATFTDNCTNGSITNDLNGTATIAGEILPKGITTVLWTVNDGNGQSATCTTVITVEDNEAPIVTCIADDTRDTDPSVCQYTVIGTEFDATFTDNCSSGSITNNLNGTATIAGEILPKGITSVLWTVNDGNGQSDTCTTVITVEDNEDPIITCPAPITVTNDPGVCGAVVNYTAPVVTDNCASGTLGLETFSFTGSEQQFIVPPGITEIHAQVYGAQGGANWVNNVNFGGLVEADIPVTPGQILYIYVGEQPSTHIGGFNGGGAGEGGGIGGGGASDIRIGGNSITDRVIVGGGAGGAGYWSGQHIVGGLGGDLVGGPGYRDTPTNPGGDPGTQTESGNGTCTSFDNPIVSGGLGFGGSSIGCGCEGYGGGGGYYGGAGSGNCRGGGGGSSYTAPTATNVTHTQGVRSGHGEVIISYGATVLPIQTAGLPSGSVFPIGTTTNTFEVTDPSGNTASCSFDVTVEDNEAPVISCVADDTRDTDAGVCEYTVVGTEFDATFTDNCTSGTITNDLNGTATVAGEALPIGINTIIWTVNDGNGQSATCTTVITVEDNEAPIITCIADTTRNTDTGVCQYTVVGTEFDATFTDNCTSGSITNDLNGTATVAGEALPIGINTIIWTVNDGNGQSATCTTVITVEDNEAPIITCIADTTRNTDTGVCQYTVVGTEFDATFTDNCTSGSITNDLNGTATVAGEVLPIGITTVVWTVNDGNGQSATCTTVITVEDNEVPIITCVADTTRNTDTGVCQYTVVGTEFDATFTDNCTSGSITNDLTGTATVAGEVLPIGATTVVWTVNDGNGQSATCTTVIIVEDNETPIISCVANDTRDTGAGVCDYTVVGTEFDATFTDNCTSGTITNDLNGTATVAGEALPIGINTIIWTVNDGNGQSATCTTVITVEDNEAPIITCIADTTRNTDTGVCQYTVVGTEFDATFTDNCTSGSITNDLNGTATVAGEVLPIGITTVVWTVNDGNGQSATCTTVITVEDNEAPIITCIADTTRNTDTGVCQYTVVGTEFDATFTDNCTSGSITNDLNGTATIAGEVLPKGVTTVLWTVNDGNGQSATCTTLITVEDNEAPIISCVANDTRDTDAGECQYTVVGTEFDATFTDNCTSGTITNDLNGTATIAGEILATGVTTVVWTVNDGNGQSATCTTLITVEDNEAPLIACSADLSANTDLGMCSAVVIFADAIALDNCGIASIVQTGGDPSGTAFPVGVSTIEYTATDIHGNVSVCSFNITVTDNEAPITVCQDITIQLDATGTATIVASDVDGGSTDNCGIASTTIDMDTFDCSNVGPNNVTLTVTDVNGNVSNCIAIVTVEDITTPVVVCQDITVQLDPTGTVTITGTDIDDGSTDACGIASYDLDIDTFDCSNVGPNTVVLTVTDVNGNSETCTATVTVEDNTLPELVCMDITLELGADGTVTITPSDVIASNTDACGIATTAVDITDFDCSDIGTPVTVQVFSEDANGNLATCFATVTVVDAFAPEITCPADQTVDPGAGNLFYEVPDYFATGEATVTDNCTDPVTITTQDPAPGTLLPDGTYTITLTATDEYGNIGTCSFELTVESVLGVNDIELEIANVSLYPNPAKEYVILSNPQAIALEQADIYDMRGRFIASIDLRTMGTEKQIDISTLASATYTVIIKYDQGQTSRRLLKE